jgi:hypothetical protein
MTGSSHQRGARNFQDAATPSHHITSRRKEKKKKVNLTKL